MSQAASLHREVTMATRLRLMPSMTVLLSFSLLVISVNLMVANGQFGPGRKDLKEHPLTEAQHTTEQFKPESLRGDVKLSSCQGFPNCKDPKDEPVSEPKEVGVMERCGWAIENCRDPKDESGYEINV
ncbi:hypothetical protein Mapa_001747 [Marchantia paleacea]|nr:hypothetical protein Mapa_001747 [Marchantia paleacea]